MNRFLFLLSSSLLLTACGPQTDTAPAPERDPAEGQALFVKHCAECHGFNARGTDKGPPLLHEIYEPSHHADITFVLAATRGVRQHHWPFGDMPPQPEVSEQQVQHIIGWVRQQQRRAGIR